MTNKNKKSKAQQKQMVLTVGLMVAFAFVFLIVFVIVSASTNETPITIREDLYQAEVAAILEDADADLGEQLIEDQNCSVCHILGDGTVAPLFDGIASRAGETRPPLSAEQYLYEAIVHPGRYILDGYTNSMPNNYAELMTDQEIGHVIAYLLTLDDTQ